MGESWKAKHASKVAVLDALNTAVKNIPEEVKCAPFPEELYKGIERREKKRKRWSIGIYIGISERADK